jgi:hypothetical protein
MSEYGISYEGTPCNIEFLEMAKDYDISEGMMKWTLHLIFVLPLLGNVGPLLNTPEKIVGYIEHFYPIEMHYDLVMIRIDPRESTFT